MIHSGKMDLLISALIDAKKDMGAVIKSEIVKGRKFSYSYATYEDILEVINKPLADHGLFVSQMLDNIDGKPALTTMVAHTSGQFKASTIPLVQVQGGSNAAQALGMVTTYTKRYSLGALFILPIIDDTDGRFMDDEENDEPEKPSRPQRDSSPKKQTEELDTKTVINTVNTFIKKFNIDKAVYKDIISNHPLSDAEDNDGLLRIGMIVLRLLSQAVVDQELIVNGLSVRDKKVAEVLGPIFEDAMKADSPAEMHRITDDALECINIIIKSKPDEEEDDEDLEDNDNIENNIDNDLENIPF